MLLLRLLWTAKTHPYTVDQKSKSIFRTVRLPNKDIHVTNEPEDDKTNKMIGAPSEDSDQPGHPPSLISVFAVRMKIGWILSYPVSAQRRLWTDWADAQAELSLRWVHRSFCWFCHALAQICCQEFQIDVPCPNSIRVLFQNLKSI